LLPPTAVLCCGAVVIPVVPLSSEDVVDDDVLVVAGVVVLVLVVDPDVAPAAECDTPAMTLAVRATPARATAPPTIPARRRSRSEDGFSVMTMTMRPGPSGPRQRTVKSVLTCAGKG